MTACAPETEILVRACHDELETRRCRTMRMPDGRVGALWRGLVYPVQGGNYIDVDGEALTVTECFSGIKENGTKEPKTNANFASIEGDGESYVLLSGPVAVRDRAAAILRAAGVTVLRAGRYLGDPIDGFSADWFVRFEKPASDEPIDELLARILGRHRAQAEVQPETASEARIRLLRDELARARGRESELRKELGEVRAATRPRNDKGGADALLAELAEEQCLRQEAEVATASAEAALQAARAELELARVAPIKTRQAPPRARLHDEIADVVGSLLPNLNLLRDSLTVAASEYATRKALYRSLSELATSEGRLPANWKSVQGASGWWERHVSDGQANTGRLYALYVGHSRRWDVLISDKAEQPRDMAWLRKYAPN